MQIYLSGIKLFCILSHVLLFALEHYSMYIFYSHQYIVENIIHLFQYKSNICSLQKFGNYR